MAELRAEPQHGGSLWSNYGNPVQLAGRYNPQDAPVSVPPPPPSHLGRPRSRDGLDYQHQYSHDRSSQQGGDGYDRYPHPSLMNNIPSINSLKRAYSQVDQPPYQEIVQDLREDYKPSAGVTHDQKLLSFKKVGDKHTIVDGKGRIFEMEIDAQLHGMFFLSEFASGQDNGSGLNAELTCYRRNLFQISGNLCFPQTPLSLLLETGETSLIKTMEVSISAIESVDGHPVRLIVIPWKTPPPNAPDVNQAPDQEPPTLPLIPWSEEESGEAPGDHYAIYPIGWRRLQFRIATANNGRRKELQQHFVLHLKLHGTLANGDKVILSELTTAPIVVRGRSPRNFQARKEIPLLGSSAGSRGQTLVETGHGIVAQAMILNKPPYDSRPRVPSLDVPRSHFTFTSSKQMPPSPMSMRSNSYPTTWNPSSQVHMPPHSGSASAYPATSMAAEPYQKTPLSNASAYTAEPQEIPLQPSAMPSMQLALAPSDGQAAPIRTQYANYVQGTTAPPQLSLSTTSDHSLSVPRYVDNNPRPSKSPRHTGHQSVHSTSSMSNDTGSAEYRYGPSSYVSVNNNANELSPHSTHPPPYAAPTQDSSSGPSSASAPAPPPRDYFPSSQSWPATAGEQGSSGVSYSNGDSRPYGFPDQYKTGHGGKSEPHSAAHGGQGVYPGSAALSHYSWGAT